jgi:hypothetical protein
LSIEKNPGVDPLSSSLVLARASKQLKEMQHLTFLRERGSHRLRFLKQMVWRRKKICSPNRALQKFPKKDRGFGKGWGMKINRLEKRPEAVPAFLSVILRQVN